MKNLGWFIITFFAIIIFGLIAFANTTTLDFLLINPTSEQIESIYSTKLIPGNVSITVVKDNNSLIVLKDKVEWWKADKVRIGLNSLGIKYIERQN